MRLCFGFVLDTALIAQGCFCVSELCLHRTKTSSVFPTAPEVSRLGVHEELGGGTAGTAGAHWQKGYPIPCYSGPKKYKTWEKEGRGRPLELWHLCSPVTYAWWSSAFLEMVEPLPDDGTWWKNSLFCTVCMHSFSLSVKLLSHHDFLTFSPLILYPIPVGGGEQGVSKQLGHA